MCIQVANVHFMERKVTGVGTERDEGGVACAFVQDKEDCFWSGLWGGGGKNAEAMGFSL